MKRLHHKHKGQQQMNKEEINREIGDVIRKFCRETGTSHVDLITVLISTHHIILNFLNIAEVSAEEIFEVTFNNVPDGVQKEAYKQSVEDGLEAAEMLCALFDAVYRKFPPE